MPVALSRLLTKLESSTRKTNLPACRNYEIMDRDEIREHTEVEVGSGSVQQGGGRGVMLRQSSRFGAMSRFDSMDDDESSLMRRSLLREASTV